MALTCKVGLENVTNLGDYVWCHYSATSNKVGVFSDIGTKTDIEVTGLEIPLAGSATPNGYFKYILVGYDFLGRKKLIADRNIQHSISWDTLNSMGAVGGKEMFFDKSLVPILSSNVNGSVAVSSSNQTNTFKLFNGVLMENAWATNVANPHITIDFGENTKVDKYKLFAGFDTTSQSCVAIDLYGSDTGSFLGEEILLDSQTNMIWDASGTPQNKEFSLDETANYRYYRFIIPKNGVTFVRLDEIQLIEKQNSQSSFSTRLLSGGISSTDKDNEWDKIIVLSDLGGAITAGDNSVWNAGSPYGASCTSTRSSSTAIVTRGGTDPNVSRWYGANSTSVVTAGQGYRPVLLVETLVFNKILILDNQNKVISRNVDDTGWVEVGTEITPALFESNAIADIASYTALDWQVLYASFQAPFKIVIFTDGENYIPSAKQTVTEKEFNVIGRIYEKEIEVNDLERIKNIQVG